MTSHRKSTKLHTPEDHRNSKERQLAWRKVFYSQVPEIKAKLAELQEHPAYNLIILYRLYASVYELSPVPQQARIYNALLDMLDVLDAISNSIKGAHST